MLQNIYHQSIPTQLAQTDLVTMHYNIESRSPFLSNQMFDYIYGLKKIFLCIMVAQNLCCETP